MVDLNERTSEIINTDNNFIKLPDNINIVFGKFG